MLTLTDSDFHCDSDLLNEREVLCDALPLRDMDRDMLKDCERLCDCEWNALNDSLRLAERERLRLCDLDILTLSN